MKRLEDIVTNNRERNLSQSFYEYGIDVSRNDVLPGHYYMLESTITNLNQSLIPNSEDEWNKNPDLFITNREYIDLMPAGLVFAHDEFRQTALILNLKIIPPRYREVIIMTHINLIEKNLDQLNVFDDDLDMISLNERKKMNLSLFKITPSILQQLTGIKLSYAISGYKLDKVARAKLMDWDHIGELPLANIDTTGMLMSNGSFNVTSIFNKFENKQNN